MTSPKSVATVVTLAGALFLSATPNAQSAAQTSTTADRVAALKQSVQASQASLRKYQWIETTIVSLKGDEKSRKRENCYYGADGKLQKISMDPPAAPPPPPSGRGGRLKEKIVEDKKDEMKDYMEKASALVHRYVPPTPELIQAAKDAGKVSVTTSQQGRVTVTIRDYLLAGDSLAIDVDPGTNRLLVVRVNTYLDKPEDTVTLAVHFGTLTDGTSYADQTTLDAKAKNIQVVIQNSGHRPMVP